MVSNVLKVCFTILLFCIIKIYSQPIEIKIGTSMPLNSPPSKMINDGIQIWQAWADARGPVNIRGQDYVFKAVVKDNLGNLTLRTQQFIELANETDYLIGATKSFAETNGKLNVGIDSTKAFYDKSNYSLGVVPAQTAWLTPILPTLRLKGAKTVTIWSEVNFSEAPCNAITASVAADNALKINLRLRVQNPFIANETYRGEWDEALQQVMDTDSDVFIVCAWYNVGELMMKSFKSKDYLPKAVVFSPLASTWDSVDPELRNYVSGIAVWNYGVNWNGPSVVDKNTFFGSSKNFTEFAATKISYPANDWVAFGAISAYALSYAIEHAPSFDPHVVKETLQRINVDTFYGKFSYDIDGACLAPIIMYQYVGDSRTVVSPAPVQIMDMVYPMPHWRERIFNDSLSNFDRVGARSRAEPIVLAMVSLAIAFSVALIIFTAYHWEHPVLRAASPPFLVILLIGSIVMYLSLPAWPISDITDFSCHIRVWCFGIGFVLLFGALLIKSWRIWRLYTNSSVEIIQITDVQLIIFLSVMVIIEVILIILATVAGGTSAVKVVVDVYRENLNYYECTSIKTPYLSVLIAYKALLMIGGLLLAFAIRRIKYTIYNESKVIIFSVYNVCFFTVLVLILHMAAPDTARTVLYAIRAVCILIGTFLTVCILFVTKFLIWNKPSNLSGTSRTHNSTRSTNSKSTTSSNSNGATGTGGSAAKEEQLEKTVSKQKRTIKKLKKKVEELTGLLDEAQLKLKEIEDKEKEMKEVEPDDDSSDESSKSVSE